MTMTIEEKAKLRKAIEEESDSYYREEIHSMVTLTQPDSSGEYFEYFERLRVPGGWIYYRHVKDKFTSTFVPSPY